jgi:hypothetical protein
VAPDSGRGLMKYAEVRPGQIAEILYPETRRGYAGMVLLPLPAPVPGGLPPGRTVWTPLTGLRRTTLDRWESHGGTYRKIS